MRYAVLLRAVNLGGSSKVAMADLRALLADLGLDDVRTLLNSGNAVFDAEGTDPAELETRIGTALEAAYGKPIPCLVRTPAEVRAVLEQNPLADVATDGSRLLVHFLSATPDGDVTALDPHARAGDRIVYQWCPDGVRNAPNLAALLDKRLGVIATARNWNTVSKLAALLDQGR